MWLHSTEYLYILTEVWFKNGKKGKKMTDDTYFISKFSQMIDMATKAPAGYDILDEVIRVGTLLLEKNISYGNSALSPIGIFAKQDAGSQIDVRIDDKLNRIKNGSEFSGDDTILDLVGYLMLKLVHEKRVRQLGGNDGKTKEV